MESVLSGAQHREAGAPWVSMIGKHEAVGPKIGLIRPHQCENGHNENKARNREARNDLGITQYATHAALPQHLLAR
jgi:hypothetical protein